MRHRNALPAGFPFVTRAASPGTRVGLGILQTDKGDPSVISLMIRDALAGAISQAYQTQGTRIFELEDVRVFDDFGGSELLPNTVLASEIDAFAWNGIGFLIADAFWAANDLQWQLDAADQMLPGGIFADPALALDSPSVANYAATIAAEVLAQNLDLIDQLAVRAITENVVVDAQSGLRVFDERIQLFEVAPPPPPPIPEPVTEDVEILLEPPPPPAPAPLPAPAPPPAPAPAPAPAIAAPGDFVTVQRPLTPAAVGGGPGGAGGCVEPGFPWWAVLLGGAAGLVSRQI